jgi:hypothetical protein
MFWLAMRSSAVRHFSSLFCSPPPPPLPLLL